MPANRPTNTSPARRPRSGAETEQARVQLRQELADLAVTAAGKIVRKELDPATQALLIEETLAEATASNGRG